MKGIIYYYIFMVKKNLSAMLLVHDDRSRDLRPHTHTKYAPSLNLKVPRNPRNPRSISRLFLGVLLGLLGQQNYFRNDKLHIV